MKRISSITLGFTIETAYLLIVTLCCLANNFQQFGSIILECTIILSISLLFINAKKKVFVTLLIIFSYNLIISIQAISVHLQNSYLSVMAMENAGEMHFLPYYILALYFSLFVIITFCVLKVLRKGANLHLSPKLLRITSAIACIGISLVFFIPDLPAPPGVSFVNTLANYFNPNQEKIGPIDPKSLKEIHYITVNTNNRYPFIKDKFYESPIQFSRTEQYVDKPNVILFFCEGLSSRTIGCYNQTWATLTPNINRFREKSMMVKNYFSHTQATYRGIRGQLASIYPTYGGSNAIGWTTDHSSIPKMDLLCLPHILNHNGYHTEMWAGCSKEEGLIGKQILEDFGFKESFCSEEIGGLLNKKSQLKTDAKLTSDRDLFAALIARLEEIKDRQPFLVAVYSSQTHAWLNVTSADRAFGDGESETLNTINNLDHCFGQFYDYFLGSTLSSNTIIVLSADHCHFPTKDYKAVVGKDLDYQPYFFDKIPLIIHDPTHVLPSIWEKEAFSSLDLAPSILHLLEFPNHPNHFLGNSIFEDDIYAKRKFVPFFGNEFMISKNGSIRQEKWTMKNQLEARSVKNILLFQRKIETENRLWSRSFDSKIIAK